MGSPLQNNRLLPNLARDVSTKAQLPDCFINYFGCHMLQCGWVLFSAYDYNLKGSLVCSCATPSHQLDKICKGSRKREASCRKKFSRSVKNSSLAVRLIALGTTHRQHQHL